MDLSIFYIQIGMMQQDGWQNTIVSGNSTTFFKISEVHISLLHTLTAVSLFFFLHTFNFNLHSNENIFTVTHHFLLFLTQCCSPVVSLHSCNLNIPPKTKAFLAASPLKISDFTSPLTISNLGFSHTTYIKLMPSKQNSTVVSQYMFAQKPTCHKTETDLAHESTEFSTSSSLAIPINASVPAICDITLATQTLEPKVEEKYHYYTRTAFSSVSHTKYLKNSNLSPSFTYTLYPQTVFPQTKYNPCEFTNDCTGSHYDSYPLLRPFFPLFSSYMKGRKTRIYSENGCWKENKVTTSKYLCCHIPGSGPDLDSMRNVQSVQHFQQNETRNMFTRQPVNVMDFLHLSYDALGGHDNVEKCHKVVNHVTNDKKVINASSVIDKNIIEFKTSHIRSNPLLVTNVRSKYNVNCRLCETQSYQRSLEKTHAIMPTFTNLDFPEPQTRTQDSVKKRHELCDQYKMNIEGSFTDNVHVINNSVLSILPTLPPDIFPEPSTKYSVQSTQIPYIYSYEVTIDHTIYYTHTWTKEKIPKSAFPLLTSQAATLLSGLSSSLDTHRVQKSLHLESSIRSLPDVTVRSTELHSVMTPHFSDNIG